MISVIYNIILRLMRKQAYIKVHSDAVVCLFLHCMNGTWMLNYRPLQDYTFNNNLINGFKKTFTFKNGDLQIFKL